MVCYLETSLEIVLGTRPVAVADYTRHLLDLMEENRQLQYCLVCLCPHRDAAYYQELQAESSRLVAAFRNAASVVQNRYGLVTNPAS
jgi:hypothetical protein